PWILADRLPRARRVSLRVLMMSSARGCRARPASVSPTCLPMRSNRRAPSCCSKVAMRLLMAGWVRCSCSAAREKEPVAATARKAVKLAMSMWIPNGYPMHEYNEFVLLITSSYYRFVFKTVGRMFRDRQTSADSGDKHVRQDALRQALG